jgi:hypothetical protein
VGCGGLEEVGRGWRILAGGLFVVCWVGIHLPGAREATVASLLLGDQVNLEMLRVTLLG